MFSIPKFSFKTYLLPILALVVGLGFTAWTFSSLDSAKATLASVQEVASQAESDLDDALKKNSDLAQVQLDAAYANLECTLSDSSLFGCLTEGIESRDAQAAFDEWQPKVDEFRSTSKDAKAEIVNAAIAVKSVESYPTLAIAGTGVVTLLSLGFVFFVAGRKNSNK